MSKVEEFINRVKTKDSPDEAKLWDDVTLLKSSDGTQEEFVELICACLSNPTGKIMRCISTITALIKWKNYNDGVTRILQQLLVVPDNVFSGDHWKDRDITDSLEKLVNNMIEYNKNYKQTEILATAWCSLVVAAVKTPDKWYSLIIGRYWGVPENWQLVSPTLKEEHLRNLLKTVEEHSDNKWWWSKSLFCVATSDWSKFVNSIELDDRHKTCRELMFQLYKTLSTLEFVDEKDSSTTFGMFTYHIIITMYTKIISGKVDVELYYKDYLPYFVQWFHKDKDDVSKTEYSQHKRQCDDIVKHLVANKPDLLNEEEIIYFVKIYLDNPVYANIGTVCNCYTNGGPKTKSVVEKYGNEFLTTVPSMDQHGIGQLSILLSAIYKNNPELFTENVVNVMEQGMAKKDTSLTCVRFCIPFVLKYQDLFKNRGDNYFEITRSSETEHYNPAIMVFWLLQQIGLIDKANGERVVALMVEEMKKVPSVKQDSLVTFLSYLQPIVANSPDSYGKYLPLLKQYAQVATLKAQATYLIDLIEGRSLKKVTDDVEKHEEDIKNLDIELGKTKDNVNKLDQRVDAQDEAIETNADNIAKTQNDVNELNERVDSAEDKIEDIDNKTVSNAPAWSKEVSKLLNPKANNDWLQVAQRLNYSASDVRGWATQPDPTMSMLAEFYTTNKTSEATKFLLKVLNDLDRPDAADVIQKYQKQSENVVQDDTSEYKAPPPVFISYQWGVQTQIKLLKQYIENEGYPCWMDLGQMGGGDMLYEKINDGIRSAKIVILCMTELYCKSANCIREVNLSNGLDKVVIPILLEKDLQWPPPGSMGPILAGKLFIRFFQRPNEQTNDERFWPLDKYEELMEKVRGACGSPSTITESSGTTTMESTPPPPLATESNEMRNLKPNQQNKSYQLCICCSPDKEPTMKVLQRDLQDAGYETQLCCYVEDTVADTTAQVYICAFCLRFLKSSMALKEVETIQTKKKPIVALLFEKPEYPVTGPMKKILSQLMTINCSNGNPTRSSQQFQDIINDVNSYMSDDRPMSGGGKSSQRRHQSLPRSNTNVQLRANSNKRLSKDLSAPLKPRRNLSQPNLNAFDNRRPKTKGEKEDVQYYNPSGPKLSSEYRQRLNNRYN